MRDLEYHDELLSLLKLPPQEDRDAVMILHLGGTFGDKAATLDRFRTNYSALSDSIKARIVLENDDVSWSVHDLLPLCEELNIPLCLDFHHHNIIFDSTQIREGTKDIIDLYPRIKAGWDKKGMRQKMHYSEPTPQAITGRQRRKHNPRPATLPPCPNDMDLMIEAKDKEQALFELMRTLKLPGWDTFNNIIPYERDDDNKPLPKKPKKKKTKKQIAAEIDSFGKELSEEEEQVKAEIPDEDVGMGGPQARVYWPPGMEEWLRPKKREVKKKGGEETLEEMLRNPTPLNFAARREAAAKAKVPLSEGLKAKLAEASTAADIQAVLDELNADATASGEGSAAGKDHGDEEETALPGKRKGKSSNDKKATATRKTTPAKRKTAKSVPTPSETDHEDELDEQEEDLSMPDLSDGEDGDVGEDQRAGALKSAPARQSGRARKGRVSYKENDGEASEGEI